jgi:predicted nucleic acid-binding protein
VNEHWIVNASPLIVLAHVGHEELLLKLADQVVVPSAVAHEIAAGPEQDRARQILSERHFTVVRTPRPTAELLAWNLGAGETAVISLALSEPGYTVILDDAAARRCARSFSLRMKGTLAVIILARQRDLIPSAATVLRQLQAEGFRLDDEIIRQALASTVQEEWS